jgi:hypothetical protein
LFHLSLKGLTTLTRMNHPTGPHQSTSVSGSHFQDIMHTAGNAKLNRCVLKKLKEDYVSSIENVAFQAVTLFFDLALAQVNLEIANLNYSNTDTLYRIAQGRYNIGTIPENQLLQMELGYLNAGTALNEATLELEIGKVPPAFIPWI